MSQPEREGKKELLDEKKQEGSGNATQKKGGMI